MGKLHLHGEHKEGSLSKTQRLHLYYATVLGNDSLADPETKAHLVNSPVRLVQIIAAKALEQLIKIAVFDAFARVENVHDQHLGAVTVGHTHPDKAA